MNNDKLSKLKAFLDKARAKDINVDDLYARAETAMSSNDTIKIVLMGAFSDGKTTTIAGLMGKVESDMKINQDESSDELTFYHLPALGHDFEIVDTPELFGSKEKERAGTAAVRYSDITREYLANAHIVIYVTDAVNSLKESHRDILRMVLRDFNKLPNAIFVINKMDEAGVNMSDEEDYREAAAIKRNTFVSRLRQTIGLTPEEEARLNISCIAADPQGRGLNFWFSKPDAYLRRSRIESVREYVKTLAAQIDKENAKDGAASNVVSDVVLSLLRNLNFELAEGEKLKSQYTEKVSELKTELSRFKHDAIESKGILQDALQNRQFEIEQAVDSAKMEDYQSIVNKYIGDNANRLTNYIEQKFSECCERNNLTLNEMGVEASFSQMSELTKQSLSWGSKFIKGTKVSADTVKSIRNFVAKGFKFKPWQAVKFAKFATRALVGIGLVIDAAMWWKQRKQQKEFEKAKSDVKGVVKTIFSSAEEAFSSEDNYLRNFAPSYFDLEDALGKNQEVLDDFEERLSSLRDLFHELVGWSGINPAKINEEIIY